jgi:hypothetical protein
MFVKNEGDFLTLDSNPQPLGDSLIFKPDAKAVQPRQ